jgi:hypothetical protein
VLRRTVIDAACVGWLVVCLVVAVPALGLAGCGSGKERDGTGDAQVTSVSRNSTADVSVRDSDGDNDSAGSRFDPDNDITLTLGHAAGAHEMQAVSALIKGYYRAAAAGDVRKACSQLYWLRAEVAVEEHSKGKGPRSLRGNTCAQVLARLFGLHRRELTQAEGGLALTALRVKGTRGLARVRVGVLGERIVQVKLERGTWRMDTLLNAGAP